MLSTQGRKGAKVLDALFPEHAENYMDLANNFMQHVHNGQS